MAQPLYLLCLLLALLSSYAFAGDADGAEELLRNYSTYQSAHVEEDGHTRGGRCPRFNLRLRGSDPVSGEKADTFARVYNPATERVGPRTRTVLILPPKMGVTPLERMYAHILCAWDIRVVLVTGWHRQDEEMLDPVMYDLATRRTVVALKRVLDYFDPHHRGGIGLLGTSLGAIKGSMMLGLEPRLSVGVLIAGGADLPGIVAHSTESSTANLRWQRMQKMKLRTRKEYEALLRKNIRIEPSRFAGRSGRKRVLAFVALEDDVVPTKHQWTLARSLGAETVAVKGGHYRGILKVAVGHRDDVIWFFRKEL